MTLAAPPNDERFLLRRITWQGYEALLREVGDQRVFITYDRGNLELMSPSSRHERVSGMITRMIWAYTEAMNIPTASFGMSTFRREDIERGLEPDSCFYIANEPRMRACKDVDLTRDPPPDLAIEIDIRRSALDRQSIYEALGVTELWVWANGGLQMMGLNDHGRYEPISKSVNLPGVPPEVVSKFVVLRDEMDELNWIRAFRKWAYEQTAGPR